MRATDYIYDSERTDAVVEAVLGRLADREEEPEYLDVGTAEDPEAARREAMLTVRESLRVGENPPGIFDEEGNVDFSAGVLITVAETGRRGLHVGDEALEALEGD